MVSQNLYNMLSKRHPNSNIYVIADHHFFHNNIINYTRENFENVLDMNNYIINKHNEIVNDNDIVFFLGDFSFKKCEIKNLLSKLNGQKYLVLGNHDEKDIVKNYHQLGFLGVYLNPIRINNLFLSHEPLIYNERDDNSFNSIVKEFLKTSDACNYHGHIHFEEEKSLLYRNVTVEVLDYKPLLIGKTKVLEEKPLFINSPYFEQTIELINKKYNFTKPLLISDYLYKMMLDSIDIYHDWFYLQGSFAFYLKYNYLSHFSDLDISFLHNETLSKNKNIDNFKILVNRPYESLNSVYNMNLAFKKKYPSLRIFEGLYTGLSSFIKVDLDSNLIFLDSYKEEDFINVSGISRIEKFLIRNNSDLTLEYQFPKFTTQVLNLNGDIANLLLQILFQSNTLKKNLALKKLYYLLRKEEANLDENFIDTLTRLFLRNVSLLATLNNLKELEHLKSVNLDISNIPNNLRIFLNSNGDVFKEVYEEIKNTSKKEILDKSRELIKKL